MVAIINKIEKKGCFINTNMKNNFKIFNILFNTSVLFSSFFWIRESKHI
jgi:hypothetical protein